MNEGLSTPCVHAGEIEDTHGSPHTPIYHTTTFKFPSTAALLARSLRTLIVRGETATRVADRLKLFALAPSLGGVESLVTQPCTTTHHGLAPEERARRGEAVGGVFDLETGGRTGGILLDRSMASRGTMIRHLAYSFKSRPGRRLRDQSQ